MTTSFKNANKKQVTEVEDVDQTALAEIESDLDFPPADRSSVALALGQVSGSVETKDLILPRLAIVQSVGPLSNAFDGHQGALVLNSETILVEKEKPIRMTVLSITKSYEENLPYEENGPRARVFSTLKEVVDAGMWTDWRDNQPPPAREVAKALLFIEEPEGVSDLAFSYEFEGKQYAIAIWTMRGSAYTRGAKRIFSASQLELKSTGILAGEWEFHTTRVQINGKWVYVPVLRLVGRNSAAKINYIRAALS